MKRIHLTRFGVLVGIPLVMTASFAGLARADGRPSSAPPANAADLEVRVKTTHMREVQLALLAAGYDPGPIDGIMGPRTKAALRQYIAVPPPQVPSAVERAREPNRVIEQGEAP